MSGFSGWQPSRTHVEASRNYGVEAGHQAGITNNFYPASGNPILTVHDCIQKLQGVDSKVERSRILETKGQLMPDLCDWVLRSHVFQDWQRPDPCGKVLWIHGDAGKGKTMIISAAIDKLQSTQSEDPEPHMLAYYYCQRRNTALNHAFGVVKGLLYQLFDDHMDLVAPVLQAYPSFIANSFDHQRSFWALKLVFQRLLERLPIRRFFFVLDAIDECVVDRERLLGLINHDWSDAVEVHWLVSSREEPNRPSTTSPLSTTAHFSVDLKTPEAGLAVQDYISRRVHDLPNEDGYTDEIRKSILHQLMRDASDTFLWVSLVFKQLKGRRAEQAQELLSTLPPGLDELYSVMLSHVEDLPGQAQKTLYLQVLRLIAVCSKPLTPRELTYLANVAGVRRADQESQIMRVVNIRGLFLELKHDAVTFIHESAGEFFRERAGRRIFQNEESDINRADASGEHLRLFGLCLSTMRTMLERTPIFLNQTNASNGDNMERQSMGPVSPNLSYACRYWIDHLLGSKHLPAFAEAFDFLGEFLLPWLEILGVCGSGPEAVLMLNSFVKAPELQDNPALRRLVLDALRTVLAFPDIPCRTPHQLHHAARFFAPSSSPIRNHHMAHAAQSALQVHGVATEWTGCLYLFDGHLDQVNCAKVREQWLVSGSSDKTIRIWDIPKGTCRSTIKAHSASIQNLAISPDGRMIASASCDGYVNVWGVDTAALLLELEHRNEVTDVDFSPAGLQLASACSDSNIRLWSVSNGKLLAALKGHSERVESVSFFDDSRLVSASSDCMIHLWDIGRQLTPISTLNGHAAPVHQAIFSSDGTKIISCSADHTVRIWDIETEDCIAELCGHEGPVLSVAMSSDGSKIASCSRDKTMRIWDAQTQVCLKALHGHTEAVQSIEFSPDGSQLISTSSDMTLRIWDVKKVSDRFIGHAGRIRCLAFSPDGRQLASASFDRTLRLWDVRTGACQKSLEGHTHWVMSANYSPDGSRLASTSYDTTIKIWDVASGACLQTLRGHAETVQATCFSPTARTHLFSSSADKTLRHWDFERSECLRIFTGHTKPIRSFALSPDASKLASCSFDRTALLWDLREDAPPQRFAEDVHQLRFSCPAHLFMDKRRVSAVNAAEGWREGGTDCCAASVTPCLMKVSENRQWIEHRSGDTLWIPMESRSVLGEGAAWAAWGNYLVTGGLYGKITMFSCDT